MNILKNFKERFRKMNKFTENELKKKGVSNNNDVNDHSEGDINNSEDKISEIIKENAELKEKSNEFEKKLNAFAYALAEEKEKNKRLQNEILNQPSVILQKFVKSVGPSIDDLLRILEKSQDSALKMVFSKLLKSFEENKIFISTPKPGDEFDPEIHNAISSVSNKDSKNGTIATSMSSVFKVYDNVVLSAMVVVNSSEDGENC